MTFSDFTYTAPEPLVIDFDPPVSIKDGSLSRLALSEPRANRVMMAEQHLTARNGSRASRMYQRTLIALTADVAEPLLDALPISAFSQAARYLQSFVDKGLLDGEGEEADFLPPPMMTITFEKPIEASNRTMTMLTLREPTLAQMVKADAVIGDQSPQRVRRWQETIVTDVSGESPALIQYLPISVLNIASAYLTGFSMPGRQKST